MVTIANFGNNFIVEIFKIAYNALTVDLGGGGRGSYGKKII